MNTALLIVVVISAYLVDCACWPYTACVYCKGEKRKFSPFGGRGFRMCPTCGGSGARRRFGRVLLDGRSKDRRWK